MTDDTSKIPATRLFLDEKPVSGSDNPITTGAVAKALADVSAQTAERAVADADGNNIGKTYARISDVIFYEETN